MMALTKITLLALCLGLSQASWWSHGSDCGGDDVGEKLMALATALDSEDGNGIIGEAADVEAALVVFDMDKDGCVDMWEWMWTLQTEFGIGAPLANSSYPFASCPLATSNSVPRSYDAFVDGSLNALIPACSRRSGMSSMGRRFRRHASWGRGGRGRSSHGGFFGKFFGKMFGNYKPPTLFDTNCDCKQARVLCQSDFQLSASDVCKGESVCTGKGTLSQRFQANVNNNDRDGDGMVTGPEIFIDTTTNYDKEGDDCVTTADFVGAFQANYNFSAAYAAGRFPPTNNTSDCLFVPSSFAPGGDHVDTVFPAGAFIDQNMGPLIQVCRSLSSEESADNCDCAQLDDSCRNDPYFQAVPSCVFYVACKGKGTLAKRFQTNLANNDRDGDGFVTAPEIFIDLTVDYDADADDCVTYPEFQVAYQAMYNFSEAYALGRWPASNNTCLFVVSEFTPGGSQEALVFPKDVFIDINVAPLVAVCDGLSPEEFASNCDCAQLTDSCSNEPLFMDTPSCIAYLQAQA